MRKLGIWAGMLVLGLTAAPAWSVPITLLHTNDTHDHLLPYDTNQGKELGGVARRATLIERIKASAPGVLVLDAGDTFQGTPLFTFFSGEVDYLALDMAGYDATTVGNHDLDNGLSNLQKQAAGRKFDLISSNLLDQATRKPLFTENRVFTRNGVKIGVFGILGQGALLAIAEKNRRGLTLADPVETAQRQADALRKQADLVVMLSHSGLDEDLALAGKVRGIDVIVGGHSHTKVERPREVVNGDWRTLVVQDFQWGENLGRLDLDVVNGKIVSYQGELLPITRDLPEKPEVAAMVAKYNSHIERQMAVVIGQAPKGLSTEGKYARDCELGAWTADLMARKTGAEIGIMNAGGLRAALQAGDVTVGSIYTIFPFDNTVVTLDLKGSTILQLLEKAAATAGKGGALQYSGLTFKIVKGKPSDITVMGKPLDPNRTYRTATIDFLAQGNDGYTLFTQGTHYTGTGQLLREMILDAVKEMKTVTPPELGRIQVVN